MWPWGHLAVAYLLYSLYARIRYGRPPRGLPAVAVAIGSQVPDLIDKPLAWEWGLLQSGRSLAHSIPFALVLLPIVYVLATRVLRRRESATAYAIGHCTHLLTDLPLTTVRGDLSGATYLLWPLLEPPEYGEPSGILVAFSGYSMSVYGAVQFALFAVAIGTWYRDRLPGLGYLRRSIRRYLSLDR